MKKDKWTGGYQPTDKLDTSNPPRQTAHEDKGAEKNEILRKHLGEEAIDKQSIRYAVYRAMQEYASNERNRAIQECITKIHEVCPSAIYEWVKKDILPELSRLKT